jgi:hypothetical protein
MSAPREGATATLLRDGRVLIAGGHDDSRTLASAEIYAPTTTGAGTFTPTGPLQTSRADAAAALLPDGRVAIIGGWSTDDPDVVLKSVEVFDPAGAGGVGAFTRLEAQLVAARYLVAAVLLPTGELLLAGGKGADGEPIRDAELFDGSKYSGQGRFRPPNGFPPRLLSGRAGAAVTLLPDGTVLFAGGYGPGLVPLATAELFDVASDQFVRTGDLHLARAQATATLLPNGKVLVAGGSAADGLERTFELYDPASQAFLGPAPFVYGYQPRGRLGAAATLLQDGRVLFTGGAWYQDSSNFFWNGSPLLYSLE